MAEDATTTERQLRLRVMQMNELHRARRVECAMIRAENDALQAMLEAGELRRTSAPFIARALMRHAGDEDPDDEPGADAPWLALSDDPGESESESDDDDEHEAAAVAADALRAAYREELEAFYSEHAPEKLANIDALLAHAGDELEGLVRRVYQRYDVPLNSRPIKGLLSAKKAAKKIKARFEGAAAAAAGGGDGASAAAPTAATAAPTA